MPLQLLLLFLQIHLLSDHQRALVSNAQQFASLSSSRLDVINLLLIKHLTKKSNPTQAMFTKADPAKLKAEIQEQETAWAIADNARDVNAVAAFYG